MVTAPSVIAVQDIEVTGVVVHVPAEYWNRARLRLGLIVRVFASDGRLAMITAETVTVAIMSRGKTGIDLIVHFRGLFLKLLIFFTFICSFPWDDIDPDIETVKMSDS